MFLSIKKVQGGAATDASTCDAREAAPPGELVCLYLAVREYARELLPASLKAPAQQCWDHSH